MRRGGWVTAGIAALLTGVAPVTAAAPPAPHLLGAVGGPQYVALRGAPSAAPPTSAQCETKYRIACYSPAQIRSAYDMTPLYAKGLNGKGETIAVVDSFGSPTIAGDLAQFDAAFGLPAPPSLRVIHPAGAIPPWNPHSQQMAGWATETTLDVEWAHAMAPGAAILVVETPVAETIGIHGIPQMVAAENDVVDHHLADVISQSWATSEVSFRSKRQLLSERSAFVHAEARHITVLGAAGDWGPASPTNAAATVYSTKREANWPASDPLVTAVGGTRLTLGAAGQRTAPDRVWNDTAVFGRPSASGGGLSTVFARPRWQAGVASRVGARRGLPDISMSAAVTGGVLIYESVPGHAGGFFPIGGTSEACPLFAGVVAIADQFAGHDLGLLNPTLYALAARHAPGIVPVTAGNNTVTFLQHGKDVTVVGWAARTGYDLATGLGTVDAAKLVPALAAAG